MPDVTVASPLPGSEGQTAEDFWTPEVAAVPGGLNEAPLPPMKSVPEHDGTPCLKWDDTLWSHADHFRARLRMLEYYVEMCRCLNLVHHIMMKP